MLDKFNEGVVSKYRFGGIPLRLLSNLNDISLDIVSLPETTDGGQINISGFTYTQPSDSKIPAANQKLVINFPLAVPQTINITTDANGRFQAVIRLPGNLRFPDNDILTVSLGNKVLFSQRIFTTEAANGRRFTMEATNDSVFFINTNGYRIFGTSAPGDAIDLRSSGLKGLFTGRYIADVDGNWTTELENITDDFEPTTATVDARVNGDFTQRLDITIEPLKIADYAFRIPNFLIPDREYKIKGDTVSTPGSSNTMAVRVGGQVIGNAVAIADQRGNVEFTFAMPREHYGKTIEFEFSDPDANKKIIQNKRLPALIAAPTSIVLAEDTDFYSGFGSDIFHQQIFTYVVAQGQPFSYKFQIGSYTFERTDLVGLGTEQPIVIENIPIANRGTGTLTVTPDANQDGFVAASVDVEVNQGFELDSQDGVLCRNLRYNITGYAPTGTIVRIRAYNQIFTTTASNNRFSQEVLIPSSFPLGSHQITAESSTIPFDTSTIVDIVECPIEVDQQGTIYTNDSLTLTGNARPNNPVTVRLSFDGTTSSITRNVVADNNGRWSADMGTLPWRVRGNYTLRVSATGQNTKTIKGAHEARLVVNGNKVVTQGQKASSYSVRATENTRVEINTDIFNLEGITDAQGGLILPVPQTPIDASAKVYEVSASTDSQHTNLTFTVNPAVPFTITFANTPLPNAIYTNTLAGFVGDAPESKGFGISVNRDVISLNHSDASGNYYTGTIRVAEEGFYSLYLNALYQPPLTRQILAVDELTMTLPATSPHDQFYRVNITTTPNKPITVTADGFEDRTVTTDGAGNAQLTYTATDRRGDTITYIAKSAIYSYPPQTITIDGNAADNPDNVQLSPMVHQLFPDIVAGHWQITPDRTRRNVGMFRVAQSPIVYNLRAYSETNDDWEIVPLGSVNQNSSLLAKTSGKNIEYIEGDLEDFTSGFTIQFELKLPASGSYNFVRTVGSDKLVVNLTGANEVRFQVGGTALITPPNQNIAPLQSARGNYSVVTLRVRRTFTDDVAIALHINDEIVADTEMNSTGFWGDSTRYTFSFNSSNTLAEIANIMWLDRSITVQDVNDMFSKDRKRITGYISPKDFTRSAQVLGGVFPALDGFTIGKTSGNIFNRLQSYQPINSGNRPRYVQLEPSYNNYLEFRNGQFISTNEIEYTDPLYWILLSIRVVDKNGHKLLFSTKLSESVTMVVSHFNNSLIASLYNHVTKQYANNSYFINTQLKVDEFNDLTFRADLNLSTILDVQYLTINGYPEGWSVNLTPPNLPKPQDNVVGLRIGYANIDLKCFILHTHPADNSDTFLGTPQGQATANSVRLASFFHTMNIRTAYDNLKATGGINPDSRFDSYFTY